MDSKSTAYFPARPKLLTSGRTDRQTDRHGALSEITFKRSCNVLKFNLSEKKHVVPIACQKYGKIDLKQLLQFPDQPSPILGSTENTTFVHLPKKSKYLKADFFVISSNIVLASELTTSRNQFVL